MMKPAALLEAAMDPAHTDRSQLLLPHFLCRANSDAGVVRRAVEVQGRTFYPAPDTLDTSMTSVVDTEILSRFYSMIK